MTNHTSGRNVRAGTLLARVAQKRRKHDQDGDMLAELTVDAIDAARREGWKLAAIGEVLDMSPQRVHQLTERRSNHEQEHTER